MALFLFAIAQIIGHYVYMKPIKWTREKILEMAKEFASPSLFKKHNPSAYKAVRRYNMLEELWPTVSRQRHEAYAEETVREAAAGCRNRAAFQKKNPSAYNAAKALGLIPILYPVQENKRKWVRETLQAEAVLYKTRSEFYAGSPGAYSVAVKAGLIESICPLPLQGTSAAEKELLQFLKSLHAKFETKRFGNDFELDCYCEELKLGIEYNGFYWHAEENKGRAYHLKKTRYFEALGIRVIHIWEHEWRDRRVQVESYLKSACRANTESVGARECEFREVSKNDAKSFLDACHIQGAPNSLSLALGAYAKGVLTAVATFGAHHRGSTPMSVLSRFATANGITINGALAKFSKLGYERLGPLLSWADYSKSQANGYLKAGWTIERLLEPDYFYATTQGGYVSKQSRKKSSVNTPDGVTESEHAKKDKLYRVWDCGKIALTYKK